MLWREESRILHLNMPRNSFTIRSFVKFLWMAVRCQLETLDAPTPRHDAIQAPARLLLFVLAIWSLQRLDIRDTRFCVRGRDEIATGLVIVRAISSHPPLRAMVFLAPSHFVTWSPGPTEWSYLLYHMLTNMVLEGEEGPLSTPNFAYMMTGPDMLEWMGPMLDFTGTQDDMQSNTVDPPPTLP